MNRTGRQPRIHVQNTIHHVMIRGNNRQQIFYGNDYFSHFLELLKEGGEKFDHKILAYCLMSNHAHMIIHVHESSLSDVMKNINFRYARWLNTKQKRIGHLFQGRFRSIEVNSEEYLIYLCRYIHLNPVVAGIVKTAGQYPWSSHQYYVMKEMPTWMDIDLVLSTIVKKTSLQYDAFINKSIDRKKWKPAISISETGEIICNQDVILKLQDKPANPDRKIFQALLSQDEVLGIVCSHLQLEKKVLFGKSKNHVVSKQRILLANYLLEHTDANIVGIAKLFQRTHGTLSRQLGHFKESAQHLPENLFPKEALQAIDSELEIKKARRHA